METEIHEEQAIQMRLSFRLVDAAQYRGLLVLPLLFVFASFPDRKRVCIVPLFLSHLVT